LILFLVFTRLVLLSEQAWAKINIESLNQAAQADARSKFPDLEKDSMPLSEMDNFLRYLMSTGNYDEAYIEEEEQNELRLKVSIPRLINKVSFNGNNEFSSGVLSNLIQFEDRQKYSSSLSEEIREKLVSFYADQGYLNMQVDIVIADQQTSNIDIVINIQEGSPLNVGAIEFLTQNSSLKSKLNSKTKKFSDKRFNQNLLADINRTIDEYFRLNRLFRAQISQPKKLINTAKTAISLQFLINYTENFSLSFEGNYSFPAPRLESALELSKFKTSNPQVGPELVLKLKEFYLLKGYARVQITSDEFIQVPNERSSITFKIEEGSQIKIKGFDFNTDKISRPQEYYVKFLKKYSGDTVASGFFHRDQIENGLKNLIIELQNEGFLRARVISSRFLYNKERDQVTISVNLDEGPLTIIKDIQISGNINYSNSDILKILNFSLYAPLKLNKLEEGLTAVSNFYKENGYLEMRYANGKEDLVLYSNDNTEAQLNLKIEEGPRVRVASLIVDGNLQTKEYVIRKEIEFKEGDFLSPSKIEESTKRLQKLGLFNYVEIRTLEENTQIADRTVVIKVSERAPGLFNAGFGVTNERELTLRGFAGIAYRNLGGIGRAVSTRLDVNYNVADIKFPGGEITGGYLEPYLFDSRTKGRVNFSRAIKVTDYQKREGSDTNQIDFLLEQNLTSHLSFSYELLSMSTIKKFSIVDGKRGPCVNPEKCETNIATTGPSLEWDSRNDPFTPSKGIISRIQMEYAHPKLGSSRTIEYLKSTASISHYYDLHESRWIWANSFRTGHLKNLSHYPDGGVPYDIKGFVLGGLSTIRGFEAGTQERFPNDQDLGIFDKQTYYLRNQNTYFLVKTELRFPIYGDLGGAIFYDGGQVKVDDIKFSDSYRESVGFGFRYYTPVGPVNLEMAWKLDPHPERGESAFRIHFSIGSF
jgi:outer membrane protein assembly complex protein YaeT